MTDQRVHRKGESLQPDAEVQPLHVHYAFPEEVSDYLVTIGGGYRIPDRFRWVQLMHPAGGPPRSSGESYELLVEVQDGTPVATEVVIRHDYGLWPDYLRRFPLTDKISEAVGAMAAIVERDARRKAGRSDMSAGEFAALRQRAGGVMNRRLITDELLEQVATVVTSNPVTPTKAVAEQLFTSHRNATRWIATARKRGFLPEHSA